MIACINFHHRLYCSCIVHIVGPHFSNSL